jgi:hypothetical protein
MQEISGHIQMADVIINFECNDDKCEAEVIDTLTNETENIKCKQYDFLAALSIAVHNDGEPDLDFDYPRAELVMKLLPKNLRFIP